jgi:hypothetical protein
MPKKTCISLILTSQCGRRVDLCFFAFDILSQSILQGNLRQDMEKDNPAPPFIVSDYGLFSVSRKWRQRQDP